MKVMVREQGGIVKLFRGSQKTQRPGISDEAIKELWEAATIRVRKDLRSPAFRREVFELAQDFRQWLEEEI
jgi:hypothetical protein